MSDTAVPVRTVLGGIEAAQRAGFDAIKVNMVVQRGVNDHEIIPMVEHFRAEHFRAENSRAGNSGPAPSDEAFDHIYARFIEVGYTPMLSQRDGKEIVVAQHGIVQPTPSKSSTNVMLLGLTIISTWFVGLQFGGGESSRRPGSTLLTAFPRADDQPPQLLLDGLPYC